MGTKLYHIENQSRWTTPVAEQRGLASKSDRGSEVTLSCCSWVFYWYRTTWVVATSIAWKSTTSCFVPKARMNPTFLPDFLPSIHCHQTTTPTPTNHASTNGSRISHHRCDDGCNRGINVSSSVGLWWQSGMFEINFRPFLLAICWRFQCFNISPFVICGRNARSAGMNGTTSWRLETTQLKSRCWCAQRYFNGMLILIIIHQRTWVFSAASPTSLLCALEVNLWFLFIFVRSLPVFCQRSQHQ